MSASGTLTLSKKEKLCGKKPIERLFAGGGSRSMSAFPLRMVYVKTERDAGEPYVKILVSVSKRHFKRAVKRNRVKRQVREAYRLNKDIIIRAFDKAGNEGLDIAFVWLDDKIWLTAEIEKRMRNLLHRVSEKIQSP